MTLRALTVWSMVLVHRSIRRSPQNTRTQSRAVSTVFESQALYPRKFATWCQSSKSQRNRRTMISSPLLYSVACIGPGFVLSSQPSLRSGPLRLNAPGRTAEKNEREPLASVVSAEIVYCGQGWTRLALVDSTKFQSQFGSLSVPSVLMQFNA